MENPLLQEKSTNNYYAGHNKFKHMSFLEIGRDNLASTSTVQVSPSWSVDLRKQLLWDLLRVETSGWTDYNNWIRKVSTVGPVLIVLDNIYNLYQFKALVPFPMALHPGSASLLHLVIGVPWTQRKLIVVGIHLKIRLILEDFMKNYF